MTRDEFLEKWCRHPFARRELIAADLDALLVAHSEADARIAEDFGEATGVCQETAQHIAAAIRAIGSSTGEQRAMTDAIEQVARAIRETPSADQDPDFMIAAKAAYLATLRAIRNDMPLSAIGRINDIPEQINDDGEGLSGKEKFSMVALRVIVDALISEAEK